MRPSPEQCSEDTINALVDGRFAQTFRARVHCNDCGHIHSPDVPCPYVADPVSCLCGAEHCELRDE